MYYLELVEEPQINYRRAMHELTLHSLDDDESIQCFNLECWALYSTKGKIASSRVLFWLGY